MSYRNGTGGLPAARLLGRTLVAASAAFLVPLLVSSQDVPQPKAGLSPASLSVSLAHDGAPADLTTTLSNTGSAALSWRIGPIRDVSSAAAPAVATGPIATAKVYAAANVDREVVDGTVIVALKETSAVAAQTTPPASFLGGKLKVKRELARARRPKSKNAKAVAVKPGRRLLLVASDDRTPAGIKKAIEDLRQDPNVAYAEPNYRVKAIATPNDPDFNLLYGLNNSGQTGGTIDADIDAPEAWDTYTGGDNVVVGIIDTGIDYLHPDLADNIWTNPGEIPGNGIDDDANGYIDDIHGYDFVNNDGDPMDDHYHGTHVAGTIAGVGNNGIGVVGVAWKAKLAALKFLNAGGSGSTADAVEAVAYANAMGFPITNNSWGGGGFSQALKDVIDAGGQQGFLFVAAAGNASNDNDRFPSYPATYESENILSVAATDHNDKLAFFSSFGATTVDLAAPGVEIYSAQPGGRYQFLSGTSMATPHVVGAAALLKSYNPQIGYAEIKAALMGGVDPVPGLAGRMVTGGRLNIQKALEGVNPPWLTIAPKAPGTLAPGASQVLTATVNPAALTAGVHKGIVTIITNDPAAPQQELEVVATVSGCKSLAVAPASLDFGSLWRTTSRRLPLTLQNSCNDFTTVTAVESSQGEFAAVGSFPVKVPPFGKAVVEIAYSPADLGSDAATLTVRSDAADHPLLTVTARGTGLEPPAVSVTPDRFEATLDPAERATRKLTVRNTGGDVLSVELRTASKPSDSAAPKQGVGARIVPGPLGAGAAYAVGRPEPGRYIPSLSPVRAAASGQRVLYLTTILPDRGEDQFSRALRALPNVGSLDVVNGGKGTPNPEYLQGFDVVIVSSDQGWSDPVALGNALADYVDAGGAVTLMVASIANSGRYGLSGRIASPGYMPIQMGGAGPGGEAVEFATHPITAGVKSITCTIPVAAKGPQGKGISLGRYRSGIAVGAVNPDKAIVALNVFPSDFSWGGDVMLMVSNTVDYLAGATSWLRLEPKRAIIPPGESFDFTLSASAEGLIAGDHENTIEIAHNAPAGANPIQVPFLLHVRPVSHLALSPAKVDFGSVMVGRSGDAAVVLSNNGNQATTVSSVAAGGEFAAGISVPFQVPPFSKVQVPVRFVPTVAGGAIGSLVFASNAADNPSLLLALRGQGLAAPLAVLDPTRIPVSLAFDAPARDLTALLSNAGAGPLAYQIQSVRDAAPPATVAPSFAVKADRIYAEANYSLPAASGELIVGLNPGKDALASSSVLTAAGVQVKRFLGRAKPPKGATTAWKPPRKLLLVSLSEASPAGVRKAIQELRKDANVAYAEPNYRVKAIATTPNDPDFNLLYGLNNSGQTGGAIDADIDAPEAWDTYTGSGNVVVGIIDTGIDYLHPDLADNIWTNPGEIPGNGIDDDANGYIDDVHGYDFVNNDSDPMDDHFHGTHVAGTIAGVGNNGIGVVGVAWKAKLAALKFLDAGGSGNTDDAIEAVAYANAMGIPITNNSWGGGGFSQALKDAIDAGGQQGYLFVAAAGNAYNDNDLFPSYPATYESENILAVAATDHNDQMASFSSFGATTVDLGAPGVDIYSAAPGGAYQFLSGTSMATPHVVGAAALLKSFNPQIGYPEIKAALMGGVDPVPDLAGRTVTGGRLNIQKALAGVSPPWLTVSPKAPGTLAPGASQVLTATVNPAGLTAGLHRGIVTLGTNDPRHPTLELEVAATVSGCKSLEATPLSVDFGAPWLGTSKRLAVTLRNKCNDFTTLTSVESTHPAFAAAGALPLIVPPFGTAVLELTYAPDDTKADKATLTLRSDAQDKPVIKVAVKGTGVKPPAIAATPAQFNLTLDPAETRDAALKISNAGGDKLDVALSIRTERKPASAGPAPKIAAGIRKAGRYARDGGALRATRIHPLLNASSSNLKVLYLTTIFVPDTTGDSFVQGLRGLPQVATLDILDGGYNTPNADYLAAYDIVVVSADYPWADAMATGDALADYVDGGGRVVLMVAAIAAGGGYELQGRMGGPDYMPIEKGYGGYYGSITSFPTHPITEGLTSIECSAPTAAAAVQGSAFALGNYDNGALLGAVHADKPIVAFNVFPGEYAWGGDVIRMMSNTLDYLAGFAAWAKVDPSRLSVLPGKSGSATLHFDAAGMPAGQYSAILRLTHNAPSGANPMDIPLSLTVRSKRCLAAAPASLDFGKIWTGREGHAQVDLVNACNQPTLVSALTLSGKTFRTAAAAPLSIAPFSKTAVDLIYVPDDTRPDKGELLAKSDAQDRPQLKIPLAGTGVTPPAISVQPGFLSATMDPGTIADKYLDVSNSGGDTLFVKVAVKGTDTVPVKPRKPRCTPGRPRGSHPLVGGSRAPLAHAPASDFKGQAGTLKVLYLHTMFMKDSSGGDDEFTRGMRGLANVGSVDLFDARFSTPNSDYLLAYDVVVVASDWGFSDPYMMGDALADYVDAGGRLVLTAGAFFAGYPNGLEGRIASPEYLPIERNWYAFDGLEPALVDHPINAGIGSFASYLYIDTRRVQGSGQPLGTYSSGALTGAYNPDKPIVALNIYPIDGYWSGDVLPLMGNTFDYLGGASRWLKPAVRELAVAPGKTRRLAMTLNTNSLQAGGYGAVVSFAHNSPTGPQPLVVPAALQVRSKRCLAAVPASLDFGSVWKDGRASLTLELKNLCNEATKVSAVRSADAAFSSAAQAVEVPAFSSAKLELAFAPKDLKLHKSQVEIVSNAQDKPSLKVPVSGQGIRPPEIAVTPGSFNESVAAGEMKTKPLTIRNAGGDALQVRISASETGSTLNRSAAALIAGSGATGLVWSGRTLSATSFKHLSQPPAAKASGAKVLYVTTLLPDSGFEDIFTQGLRALPEVGSVQVLNAEFQTPNSAYLAGFDDVIVAAAAPFADAAALGDALADYVDAGGKVCVMTAAISDWPGLALAGRISTPDYMPLTMTGPGPGGPVVSFENHPINAGINYLASWGPTDSREVQGEGQPLGRLDGGNLLGAYHASKAVVALNVFPADGAWEGDLLPMMGNIIRYLSDFGGWLRVNPSVLTVPAGGSATADVVFDGRRAIGGVHTAGLRIEHNAPATGPVSVPATLTVAGRTAFSVSAPVLDFGDLLLGETRTLDLALANTGNLPVTVAMVRGGSPAFTVAGPAFPLTLEAGRKASLKVTFAPTANGSAAGELAFSAAGAGDPVRTALKGKGLRPADLAASTTPDPLRFTVPFGGQASGNLRLADRGDEGLSYRIDLAAAPDAASRAAAASPAYGPEHFAPLAKGALDTRVGRPVDLSAGGPDGFGHRWSDSREPGGPVFAWTDISATGRRLNTVSGCDDCSEEAALSFPFPFYGTAGFPAVQVASNGYVTFGAPASAYANYPIPSGSMPGNLVAALFQDLYPPAGGGIFFQDFGNRAVIQWKNVPDFLGTGSYDFEIVLFADGTVDLLYNALTGVKNTASVGIQDGKGADGLGIVYNAAFLENALAIRLRTWVTVPARAGRLAGQGEANLPVSLDSRGLAPGTYRATLGVAAGADSGRDLPAQSVPVEITVSPATGAASR